MTVTELRIAIRGDSNMAQMIGRDVSAARAGANQIVGISRDQATQLTRTAQDQSRSIVRATQDMIRQQSNLTRQQATDAIRAAQDRARQVVRIAQDEAKAQIAALRQVEQARENLRRELGGAGKSVADGAFRAGVAVLAGIGAAVKEAAQFDQAMRNVNSIVKASEPSFNAMRKAVMGVVADPSIRQGPTDLAKGLYDIASSGFTGQKALDILRISARGASAGMTDTATASKALTAVLNSGIKGVKEPAQAMDVLFKIVDRGVTTFPQLANSIGQVLPFASKAGVSMQEVGAFIAVATKQGQSAAESINDLSNVLNKIIDPGKENAKVWNHLKIEYGAAALQGKGLGGVLADIIQKTGGNQDKLKALFPDMQAFRGLLAAGKDSGRGFAEELGHMAKASEGLGATTEALNQQNKGAMAQWELVRKEISILAVNAGNVLLPSLLKITTAVSGWFQRLNSLDQELIQSRVMQFAWTAAILTGVGAIGKMAFGVFGLVKGFAEYRAAMVAVQAVQGATAARGIALFAAGGPYTLAIGAAVLAVGALVAAWWQVRSASEEAASQERAAFAQAKSLGARHSLQAQRWKIAGDISDTQSEIDAAKTPSFWSGGTVDAGKIRALESKLAALRQRDAGIARQMKTMPMEQSAIKKAAVAAGAATRAPAGGGGVDVDSMMRRMNAAASAPVGDRWEMPGKEKARKLTDEERQAEAFGKLRNQLQAQYNALLQSGSDKVASFASRIAGFTAAQREKLTVINSQILALQAQRKAEEAMRKEMEKSNEAETRMREKATSTIGDMRAELLKLQNTGIRDQVALELTGGLALFDQLGASAKSAVLQIVAVRQELEAVQIMLKRENSADVLMRRRDAADFIEEGAGMFGAFGVRGDEQLITGGLRGAVSSGAWDKLGSFIRRGSDDEGKAARGGLASFEEGERASAAGRQAEGMRQLFKDVTRGFEKDLTRSFELLTTRGIKPFFSSLLDAIRGTITRILADIATSAIMRQLLGSKAGDPGAGGAALGGLLGKAGPLLGAVGAGLAVNSLLGNPLKKVGKMLGFADGGLPPVGRASIVGERGPELYVPSSAGRVVPNHQLGGPVQVNVNWNQLGPVNSEADERRLSEHVVRQTQDALRMAFG